MAILENVWSEKTYFKSQRKFEMEKVKSMENEYKGAFYIMAGHAIVVVKDINLLFFHGNAVILTLW